MPPRRRRSASEMLEELKRRRRESMAREGATAAEELTEARDVPIPLASAGVPRPDLQSTRPPNIGEFIRLTSTLKMPERQLIHNAFFSSKEEDPRLPAYQGDFLERSEDFFKDLFQGTKAATILTKDDRTGAQSWFPGMTQEEKQV